MTATAAAIAEIAARLAASGIEEARREARLLLAFSYGIDATGLLALADVDMARVEPILVRRMAREPLAYISGHREFWGLDFLTSPATLIPRPDSETLVEAALAAFPNKEAKLAVLDLGTGTGCLLLSVLHERRQSFGIGVDIAPGAARLAAANAARLGLAQQAGFLAGDWTSALSARFDLILSNPPYIRAGEIAALMPEVASYEPLQALDGGADGLDFYRRLISELPSLLRPDGAAVLEIGFDQAKSVSEVAHNGGFAVALHKDLSGQERALTLRLK